MNKLLKAIIELLVSALTIALALDLIYLYVYERWYDPLKSIEITELALLGAIAFLGAINTAIAAGELAALTRKRSTCR